MAGRIRKLITSPAGTLGAFALAAGLLASSSIGGARAALTYYSETYTSRVQMYDIGVTLLENGQEVSWRNYDSKRDNGSWQEEKGALLEDMVPEGDSLRIGVWYPEELKVQNRDNQPVCPRKPVQILAERGRAEGADADA